MITRPMLAATIDDLEEVPYKFPLICTPKLNGWRCLKVGGKVLTRKFKPQPNVYIRETLEKILPDGMDGEILIKGGTYNDVQKQVSRRGGEPDFEFWAFDYVRKGKVDRVYDDRLNDLQKWAECIYDGDIEPRIIQVLPCHQVCDLEDLLEYEEAAINDGHEGICLRTPDSPYKCGRSTLKQQWLMKYKRFADSEFEVIGFVEAMENQNPAGKDAFGGTKRGKKKEFLVGKGTLGALIVRDIHHGWEFELGTGWNDEEKLEIWTHKKKFKGKIGNYKYQKHGMTDRPLAASFQGWRYD